jgi:hypothetical protein
VSARLQSNGQVRLQSPLSSTGAVGTRPRLLRAREPVV